MDKITKTRRWQVRQSRALSRFTTDGGYCTLMEVISLDDSLAQGSGMAFGTDVWHVEIVRSLDGKALIHSEGFLRASVVPRLSRDVLEMGRSTTTSRKA